MDISKLKTPTRGPVRNRSIYDDWIATLSTVEQDAVLEAVKDPRWGHVALLKELVSEGAPDISSSSFQAWRHKKGLTR
ncbi:hypothetical protein AB0230_01910 [Microbacterium sp. NPDC089190]|uniref:hypothetical protein n=1 Tax=Microbacterium sp. NPDC089190 TaxID=3155063 RepID=UPI00344E0632